MLKHLFRLRLKRAQLHAELIKQRQEISSIYHSNDKPKDKIAFGKLLLSFVLIDFALIELFCMFFMVKYPEYSDMGSFIGIAIAIIGQVRALVSYNKKATAENTVGGIVYDSVINDNEESVG